MPLNTPEPSDGGVIALIVTDVSPLHPENALLPIEVTLSGIVTVVRPLQ